MVFCSMLIDIQIGIKFLITVTGNISNIEWIYLLSFFLFHRYSPLAEYIALQDP